MSRLPKAYNELVGLLLTEEDRAKFEWAIGSILCDGSPTTVIIYGDPASGKSTLLNIARKVFLSDFSSEFSPRVAFQHDGYVKVDQDVFVFAASLHSISVEGAIYIRTTGDRVPVNKHYVLMNQIDSEAVIISEHCIDVYHNGPRAVYNQENNR